MATYTASEAHSYMPARMNAVGPTVVVGKYIANATTISSGDTYMLAKVPNGCTITDMRFFGRSSGTGGIVFNLGISGSTSLFGAGTVSGTDQYIPAGTTALPYTVSLSDDAAVQFITVLATMASGTATATGTFGVVLTYGPRGASTF